MANYKLIYTNVTTSHLGSECELSTVKAQPGNDYRIPNLIMMQMNAADRIGKNVKINLGNVYVVRVYYSDGMYRELGCKLRVDVNDGIWLFGNRSKFFFKRISD